MSIKVDPSDLELKAASQGEGFLLTAGHGGGPHAMNADFQFSSSADGVLASCHVGKTARANIDDNGSVTMLWSPGEVGGFSLIADGDASIDDDGLVTIVVRGAVLHRRGNSGARPQV